MRSLSLALLQSAEHLLRSYGRVPLSFLMAVQSHPSSAQNAVSILLGMVQRVKRHLP